MSFPDTIQPETPAEEPEFVCELKDDHIYVRTRTGRTMVVLTGTTVTDYLLAVEEDARAIIAGGAYIRSLEPDFLAGTAACSLNPDDETCESCS